MDYIKIKDFSFQTSVAYMIEHTKNPCKMAGEQKGKPIEKWAKGIHRQFTEEKTQVAS